MVVSLTRGDTLFAQNAGEMMQPASTMKLFSTAVALDRFGPEHTFSTDVLRDGALGADGTVSGNVYLRADGDPRCRRDSTRIPTSRWRRWRTRSLGRE